MENFKAYFKMNFSQILWELLCMIIMGFIWWLVAGTLLIFIAFPLLVGGIVYCSVRIDRKLIRDSFQGKSANLHMSLPVGSSAMVLTKVLLGLLSILTVTLSLAAPLVFSPIFGVILTELGRNLAMAVNWEEHRLVMGAALVLNFIIWASFADMVDMLIIMRSSVKNSEEPDKLLNKLRRVYGLLIWVVILVVLRVDAAGNAVLKILESIPVMGCLWGLAAVGAAICGVSFRGCVKYLEERYQKV